MINNWRNFYFESRHNLELPIAEARLSGILSTDEQSREEKQETCRKIRRYPDKRTLPLFHLSLSMDLHGSGWRLIRKLIYALLTNWRKRWEEASRGTEFNQRWNHVVAVSTLHPAVASSPEKCANWCEVYGGIWTFLPGNGGLFRSLRH